MDAAHLKYVLFWFTVLMFNLPGVPISHSPIACATRKAKYSPSCSNAMFVLRTTCKAKYSKSCSDAMFYGWFCCFHQQQQAMFCQNKSHLKLQQLGILPSSDYGSLTKSSLNKIRWLCRLWTCSTVKSLRSIFATDHERLA